MGNAYAGKGPAPSDRVPSRTVDLQQEERKLEQIEQQASGTEKAQVSQGLVHTYVHKILFHLFVSHCYLSRSQ